MNQKNALEFGREQGRAWQQQTTFVDKAMYLEYAGQCAAYHARSQKAYDLFVQGWTESWVEPKPEMAPRARELPQIDLSDPNVITLLAHYLLQ